MQSLVDPFDSKRLIHGDGTRWSDWQQSGRLDSLARFDLAAYFSQAKRVIIIAPHPDDEILGCAGLIQQAAELGCKIVVVAVTDGTGSHPGSSYYTQSLLKRVRPAETQNALRMLELDQEVEYWSLRIDDGKVTAQADLLYEKLNQRVQAQDVLITTFEKDGHPDHEACGQVVKRLAHDRQLTNYQVLIWAWHWATPDETSIDWTKCLKLELSESQLVRKKLATQCFKSQCEADPSTGQPAILSKQSLERLLQPMEIYQYG